MGNILPRPRALHRKVWFLKRVIILSVGDFSEQLEGDGGVVEDTGIVCVFQCCRGILLMDGVLLVGGLC